MELGPRCWWVIYTGKMTSLYWIGAQVLMGYKLFLARALVSRLFPIWRTSTSNGFLVTSTMSTVRVMYKKWLKFCRLDFQVHFLESKYFLSWFKFQSLFVRIQLIICCAGSGNGSAPNTWHRPPTHICTIMPQWVNCSALLLPDINSLRANSYSSVSSYLKLPWGIHNWI